MPYIAPEVITEAKRMDLLTYLREYEPGAPVVPAAILGTDKIFANGGFLPKLTILVGEPMHFTGDRKDKAQLEAFSQSILDEIARMKQTV